MIFSPQTMHKPDLAIRFLWRYVMSEQHQREFRGKKFKTVSSFLMEEASPCGVCRTTNVRVKALEAEGEHGGRRFPR